MIQSKVTAQGQVSIPANVRMKLGIEPGSTVEWEEDGDRMCVRRSGTVSSEDIHLAIFPAGTPAPKTLRQLKKGIAEYARERYARG